GTSVLRRVRIHHSDKGTVMRWTPAPSADAGWRSDTPRVRQGGGRSAASVGSRDMSSVAEFRDHVLDVAGRVLRAHHPAFVAAVDGVVTSGTGDAEHLLTAIRDVRTPEFRPAVEAYPRG